MEITRQLTWDMYKAKWCCECGKITEMVPVHTGMPGIVQHNCPECESGWMVNYLESADDILTIPDDFIVMKFNSNQY